MSSALWRDKILAVAMFAAVIHSDAIAAEPSAPAGLVECRIAATVAGGFLKLQAMARSTGVASGRYVFAVSKHSAGGSTDNRQSGNFTLAPGEERALTTVMLEAAADGHYSARLSLTWDGGSATCQAP